MQPYGTFVELAPNLTGLADQTEGLREDDRVSVYLKAILPDRMKVKLTILQTLPPKVCRIRSPTSSQQAISPVGCTLPRDAGGGHRNGLRLTFPLDPGPILLCGLFGLILFVVVVDPILQRVGEVLLLYIVIGIIMGITVPQAMARFAAPP